MGKSKTEKAIADAIRESPTASDIQIAAAVKDDHEGVNADLVSDVRAGLGAEEGDKS